ncbi:MAG: hypothetical protein AB8F95_00805 [Bacteroidia bacterium]
MLLACGGSSWDPHQYYDDLEFAGIAALDSVIKESDEVIAYNWNDHEYNPANTQHHIVDAYGVFDKHTEDGHTLSKAQVIRLGELMNDTTHFGGYNSMCFIPHIAFVYYKKGNIIGQSNICFMCSGIKSVPKSTGALSEKGIAAFEAFCEELGLEIIKH